MQNSLKVACIQLNSGPIIAENIAAAEKLIRQAAAQGAKLIATPENTCQMRTPAAAKLEKPFAQENHPGVKRFADLAKELGVWLLIGSMAVRATDVKLHNRSFLFDDQGKLVAHYDKIHMFDVVLSETEKYAESDNIEPGRECVVTKTPWGLAGLTVCYDLRFPHLYRDLAKAGAGIIFIPAAFTVPTGRAHWETLVRARAIENGAFVIAPAQTGEHEGGRKTWGHSLIVDPWGKILADGGESPGIVTADLDLSEIETTRKRIPSLTHDREYEVRP